MKITSAKKIAANRANGALSHGPTTPEGKARSSQNATRHGLLSQIVCLSNESKEAFEKVMDDYCQRLGPVDEVEKGLVEEMVAAAWRSRRAIAIETQMMDVAMESHPTATSEIDRLTSGFSDLSGNPKLNTLIRYQTRLHQRHSRLLRDFILLRKAIPPNSEGPCPSLIPVSAADIPVVSPPPPCPDSTGDSSPDPAPADTAPEAPVILLSPSCVLPNEPISPFPTNKTISREPIAELTPQPVAGSTPSPSPSIEVRSCEPLCLDSRS
jgi:hypothetical protein